MFTNVLLIFFAAYTPWSAPPSPINALPNSHSTRADSSLRFTPEAMFRAPGHAPAAAPRETREPGRRPHRGVLSDDGSAGDSRVGSEPVDNSPDPHMPLVPLRLEEGRLA
ncbi:hypothetical protein C8Q80DRAFT_1140078 [Daedaleopsis nitida]|nr:hypothetical protein C8Q80DRAFT_1140078 [Daedaleopsis nitida]